MTEYIKCETCLYNKNCQLLAKYKNTIIEDCSAYKNAADVVEIIHGEWEDDVFINNKFPSVRCSECNIRFCDIINNHRSMWHYCPYCGAKMNEETYITFNNQENVKENTKNTKVKVRLRRTGSRNNM